MRLVQAALFLALSLLVHLSALGRIPDGEQSAGMAGEAVVTLVGQAGALADIVDDWETPPEVREIAEIDAPPPSEPAPNIVVSALDAVSLTQPDAAIPQSPPAETFTPPEAMAVPTIEASSVAPMVAPSAAQAPDLPSVAMAAPQVARETEAIPTAALPQAPQVDSAAAPPSDLAEPDAPQIETAAITSPLPGPQPAPQALPDTPPAPRPTVPQPPQVNPADSAPDAPQIDTTPPPPTHALRQARRPVARPDRLTPPDPPPRQAARSTLQEPVVDPKRRNAAPAPAPSTAAAGSGGGTNAGTQGQAAQSTLSAGQRASAMTRWGSQIQRSVQRAARRNRTRENGQVVVTLRLTPQGQLQGVRVGRSSGSAAVDQAAMAAVQRVGRFPNAPRGLTQSSYQFNLPVRMQ